MIVITLMWVEFVIADLDFCLKSCEIENVESGLWLKSASDCKLDEKFCESASECWVEIVIVEWIVSLKWSLERVKE